MSTKSKSSIFSDTVKITPQYITPITDIVCSHLKSIGINFELVGSAYTADPLKEINDIDLQVELSDTTAFFNAPTNSSIKNDTDDKANRRALRAHFNRLGFETAQSGINVFVRVPYLHNFYQVDLEIVHNVDKICKYHRHNIPENSKYKGAHKQIMLFLLAKRKHYVYSAWEGLYERTADNKKGRLVTNDWDEIAECLIGVKDSTRIDCVEHLLDSVPEAYDILREAEKDKNWL